jgi:hypothetical protein
MIVGLCHWWIFKNNSNCFDFVNYGYDKLIQIAFRVFFNWCKVMNNGLFVDVFCKYSQVLWNNLYLKLRKAPKKIMNGIGFVLMHSTCI